MGKSQTKIERQQSEQIIPQRVLSPLEQWNVSEQSHQDLLRFLESSPNFAVWTNPVNTFLKGISHRQKYQNFLVLLLEYVKSDNAKGKTDDNNRREMFTYYSNRLKNSYFTVGEFKQSHVDVVRKPHEKLYFLYEYYSMNEDLLNKAILSNYPTIFLDFRFFISDLLENDILVKDVHHFSRFIISHERIQEIKEHFQRNCRYYVDSDRQRLTEEVQTISNMQAVYLSAVEEFLKYDYADMAALIMGSLIQKGYELFEEEMEYYLKIELYSLFLYELGKISLTFSQINKMSILQIIHYFFSNQNIEQTSQLKKCFDIFPQPTTRWNHYIFSYLFSPLSHLSVLIKLIEHKFIKINGDYDEFHKLLNKLKMGRSQIGRYADYLCKLAEEYDIAREVREKFIKFIKVIQLFFVFNIDWEINTTYDLIYENFNLASREQSGSIKEIGLNLIKELIAHYFKVPQIKTKRIVIEREEFMFVSFQQLFNFLHFFKDYLFGNIISNQTMHQIIFNELIIYEQYAEIKELLSPQNINRYEIVYQAIQMVITDHIIKLMSNNRVKKIEVQLLMLLGMIRLPLSSKQINHYLLAYYQYFKYLEERQVILSMYEKEEISIKHFYSIVDNYSSKIESIDFNYLFALQSCIKSHYVNSKQPFSPVITDQYLKFKIYQCNKAFNMKKVTLGNDIIEEIVRYEPPWISTQLIKICKENENCDENFLMIAFNYCTRGEDLEYILSLYKGKGGNNKMSINSIKKLLKGDDNYLLLTNQLIIDEQEYRNLVAELTYNQEKDFKIKHELFFKLLGIEPERSFYYAINYNIPANFVLNFIMEGIKKSIFEPKNMLCHIIKYLYFKIHKELNDYEYVRYKVYVKTQLSQILQTNIEEWKKIPSLNTYLLDNFCKMINNYKISKLINEDFLELYILENAKFKFLYDQKFRKDKLVELRDQPMTKEHSIVLRRLCQNMSIDIVQLSLYNLYSRINVNECIDDECWTIVKKLIYWGDERQIAYNIVQKLSQKVIILNLLANVYEYLRESEATYKSIITKEHLQIIKSIAAVDNKNSFFGIIPQNYFEKPIGVYPNQSKVLSDTHRRLIKDFGSFTNIFVISKALFFMYGCSDEIQRLVLSEFSLQLQDSQEFEALRKRIRNGSYR